MSENSRSQTYLHFQLITVSFYPYLFISIHGKTLLICMLLLTCLFMPINNAITQTIFMVLFTSGSLLTWGKPLDTSSNISPRYLSATYSQLTISLLLQTTYDDRLCFLLPGVRQVGEGPHSAVGASYLLFPLAAIPPTVHNPIRAVLPDELKAWEEK